MEFAMMDELVSKCLEKGITEIRGYYYPTEKNKMVREFYGLQGFSKIEEDEKGNSVWKLDLNETYVKKNNVIEINKIAL